MGTIAGYSHPNYCTRCKEDGQSQGLRGLKKGMKGQSSTESGTYYILPEERQPEDPVVEFEKAAEKLQAGPPFSDIDDIDKTFDGRSDFWSLQFMRDSHTPIDYLVALAINRYTAFHAKGLQVALAAGASERSYCAGPIKMQERIEMKCADGGDYGGADPADEPSCKRVLDVLRGMVMCSSNTMMEKAYMKAIEIFGQPAVVKDRRQKPQHDILMVFKVEGLYVEMQLHNEASAAIKLLAHAVFEIQRLNDVDDVAIVDETGLDTVMELPGLTFADGNSMPAQNVAVLLRI